MGSTRAAGRNAGSKVGVVAAAVIALLTALLVPIERTGDAAVAEHEAKGGQAEPRATRSAPRHARTAVPEAGAIERAWDYASGRAGPLSVAVIDSRGRLHGFDAARPFYSASVSKVLLLAAELGRLEAADAPLDDLTAGLLTRMITISDNDAADAIYQRVGDAAIVEAARAAGMESFGVAGYWAEARITAADMARFMWHLDDAFAGPHREFALGLLGSVVTSQRWGIPAGVGEGWKVRFKGGWRPTGTGSLVHQAAELRGGGERVALAVLSDGQPSHEYGTETLRGIADRLVGPKSSEPWDGRWR